MGKVTPNVKVMIKKVVKTTKENWIKKQCRNIDEGMDWVPTKRAVSYRRPSQHNTSVIEDSNYHLITEITQRGTEYCSDLYNFQLKKTIKSPKKQNSQNISPTRGPDSCTQYEEKEVTWGWKRPSWAAQVRRERNSENPQHPVSKNFDIKQWTREYSLAVPFLERKQQNRRTISLISHPNKANRLNTTVDELLAEYKANFLARCWTDLQLPHPGRKHLHHQSPLPQLHRLYKTIFQSLARGTGI